MNGLLFLFLTPHLGLRSKYYLIWPAFDVFCPSHPFARPGRIAFVRLPYRRWHATSTYGDVNYTCQNTSVPTVVPLLLYPKEWAMSAQYNAGSQAVCICIISATTYRNSAGSNRGAEVCEKSQLVSCERDIYAHERHKQRRPYLVTGHLKISALFGSSLKCLRRYLCALVVDHSPAYSFFFF